MDEHSERKGGNFFPGQDFLSLQGEHARYSCMKPTNKTRQFIQAFSCATDGTFSSSFVHETISDVTRR